MAARLVISAVVKVDTLIFRNILPGACNKANVYIAGEMAVAEMLFLCDGLLNIRAALTKQPCSRLLENSRLALLDETHYIFSSRWQEV